LRLALAGDTVLGRAVADASRARGPEEPSNRIGRAAAAFRRAGAMPVAGHPAHVVHGVVDGVHTRLAVGEEAPWIGARFAAACGGFGSEMLTKQGRPVVELHP
jgi:hypothetical protein